VIGLGLGTKCYKVSIATCPQLGSSSPPAIKAPMPHHPAMVPSGHAQPQRCTEQTSHPFHQNRQTDGIRQQGRATAVDGSKIPISGQDHIRYPCHPPWHSPPGVCLRSRERPVQGRAIGRAEAAGASGHEMGVSRPHHGPVSLHRTYLGWVHGGAGSVRERPSGIPSKTAAA
jgi:hypothetical protein